MILMKIRRYHYLYSFIGMVLIAIVAIILFLTGVLPAFAHEWQPHHYRIFGYLAVCFAVFVIWSIIEGHIEEKRIEM